MRSYLVESYAVGSVVDEQRDRARRAAEVGTGVRYVRTTFLPGDETVLHVFEASSAEALREAASAAALPYERIVEAVEGRPGPTARENGDNDDDVTSVDAGSRRRRPPCDEGGETCAPG
jgi:hypothetical protein